MSIDDVFGRLAQELREGAEDAFDGRPRAPTRERVLIIVDGLRAPDALADALRRGGFDPHCVPDPFAALALVRATPFGAALVAMEPSRGSGAEIAEGFARLAPGMAIVILASRPPTSTMLLRCKRIAGARLLAEGAAVDDIVFAVNETLEHNRGFSGGVFGFAISDLLQLCHLGRRTLTLELQASRAGAVHFLEGQLVHAELVFSGPSRGQQGALRGEAALVQILDWSSGRVRMVPLRSHERSVEKPTPGLLLDLMHQIDEDRRARVVRDLVQADPAAPDTEPDDDIAAAIERTLGQP